MVPSGAILGNIFFIVIIDKINRKRDVGNLILYFHRQFKMMAILGEYRRLYPGGKLHIYCLASFAIAIIGMISWIVCLFTIL